MDTQPAIPSKYDPSEVEPRISAVWLEHRVNHVPVEQDRDSFCIVIPPPNVTGILHMGHVLDNIVIDAVTRWHRMRGFSSVWIPGTDHAGIATQNVVKRRLADEGINYKDLGRERFSERVWEWKEKHGDIIINQLKRLGCSCDWDRERFTLDEGLSRAVTEAFITFYERGLIYKGKRIINWCTVCETALSNDEVEHETHQSHLWNIKYPVLDTAGSPTGDFVTVATTRPETMLGDTALAVNPEDERYKSLVGARAMLPLQERPIPVVADSFVDPEFGTGIVKVTPAHDPNDYQCALNHDLPLCEVIGADGRMTAEAGEKYSGMDRYEARKAVVADLETQGLLVSIEDHTHTVGNCYRCHSTIEPLVSDQWFMKMKPLAEKARAAVNDQRIEIIPASEKHDFFHWLDTIQDWCISRQLWWGHRIPIYYCDSCQNVMACAEAPSKCNACSSSALRQDEDVLDTWFSSQLWPFSSIGWPAETPELKQWYPNNWLLCGRDIIFFWGARMVFAGLELMGDVPFRKLGLHGIVRDEKGRKLSKSLGNSPDPIELFDKYGTDAVRATVYSYYPMGRQDVNFRPTIYEEGQALVTKLWNATRFLRMGMGAAPVKADEQVPEVALLEDRWILSKLRSAVELHDKCLDQCEFAQAFQALVSFFWNDYCDWFLEIIKPRLREENLSGEAIRTALYCNRTILKVFHPYLPFVTEELWQAVGGTDGSFASLLDTDWVKVEQLSSDSAAESAMNTAISIVRRMRDLRHHLNLPPKGKLPLKLSFFDPAGNDALESYQSILENLGFASDIELTEQQQAQASEVPIKFEGGVGYAKLPPDAELDAAKDRLSSKLASLEKAVHDVERKLENKNFMEKAPQAVVEEHRARASEYRDAMGKLKSFIDSL